MGFNFSGIVIKKVFQSEEELGRCVESKVRYLEEVGFEEALTSFKEEAVVDVYQSKKGALLLPVFGRLSDLRIFAAEAVQFILSDVSDTFYFEKYASGQLVQKFIMSDGELIQNTGNYTTDEDEDWSEKIWQLADEYVLKDFSQHLPNLKFGRYELIF